jgi:uncharacterized protein YdeI (YjbR/CyaY-like superfamily)
MNSFVISENLMTILKNDVDAYSAFEELPPSHKKQYAVWIMSAKKEETRIRRMNKMIRMVKTGQRIF